MTVFRWHRLAWRAALASAIAFISFDPIWAKDAAPEPGASGAIRVLLVPAKETTLSSQIAGRIQDVAVSLGESVNKGKIIVRFECDEQQARLRMAEADLASARENHEAKLRLQGLQQAGEVEVSLAASNAEKSRAQVALYRAQLAQCSVVAPFTGRVVKLGVKPYQSVTQGQVLLDLVSAGPLKLRVNVPGKWVSWLKKGTPFEVQIDETGRKYPATVSAINARIDAVSQTIELEAVVARQAPELLPGMSGVASFSIPKP